jgi:hypothetical protein
MRKSLIVGALLALAAAVILWLGELLGLDLQHVALLGAALGGVVGLVQTESAVGRVGGFLVGFVFAWIGFAVRAAILPDSTSGRAVAAFVVMLACAVACALSFGRMPLWSALVGAAAIVGAYEETYTNSPSEFLAQSPTAATTVLLTAAMGFLVTSWLTAAASWSESPGRHEPEDRDPYDVPGQASSPPPGSTTADDTVDLRTVLSGEEQ